MALRNLLDNAIKASPPSGSITLRGQVAGRELALSVQDHGSGIPEDALPHVFERFYRVDPARSRQQSGAGLGLALVQAIAPENGGRVEVQSKPGEGSTFTIYLPIKNTI